MPNQPGNCSSQVHREKPRAKVREMQFYGHPRHCIGAYYFGERN